MCVICEMLAQSSGKGGPSVEQIRVVLHPTQGNTQLTLFDDPTSADPATVDHSGVFDAFAALAVFDATATVPAQHFVVQALPVPDEAHGSVAPHPSDGYFL